MERVLDSVQEVDRSEARGNRQGEGERDDHEPYDPFVVLGPLGFRGARRTSTYERSEERRTSK